DERRGPLEPLDDPLEELPDPPVEEPDELPLELPAESPPVDAGVAGVVELDEPLSDVDSVDLRLSVMYQPEPLNTMPGACSPRRTSAPPGNEISASDAITAVTERPSDFRTAISTASTRLTCPPPIPTSASRRASTIAFDRTCLTDRHANSMSVTSSSVGARSLTVFRV